MAAVDQQAQPRTVGEDFEGAIESVKVERNTKGVTFSYRVAKKPNETWEDVFRTIDMVHNALVRRFGEQR